MLLFYGKNHKHFYVIYQYLQTQEIAMLITQQQELQHHIFVVHTVTYSDWNFFMRKKKGSYFFFLRLPLPYSIHLYVIAQQIHGMKLLQK